MRCHDILGVQENCDRTIIDKAYADKNSSLNKQINLIPRSALEAKRQEIENAKVECILWIDLTPIDRIKRKIRESVKSSSSPNRMNGVTIGCCTLCDEVCGGLCNDCGKGTTDSCCEYNCGSQTVPIACDIIIYAIIGGIILFSALAKLFKYRKRANAENKHRRYHAAVAKQPSLQQSLNNAEENVRKVVFTQSVKEKRRNDLYIYSDFFESIGTIKTDELRIIENERVLAHNAEIQKAKRAQRDIQNQIDKNNRIIHKGP